MSDLPGRVRGRAVFSGDRVEPRQEGLLEVGRMLVDAGRAVEPARRVGMEREALGGFERGHAGCKLGIGLEGIQLCQHRAPVGYGRRDVAVGQSLATRCGQVQDRLEAGDLGGGIRHRRGVGAGYRGLGGRPGLGRCGGGRRRLRGRGGGGGGGGGRNARAFGGHVLRQR